MAKQKSKMNPVSCLTAAIVIVLGAIGLRLAMGPVETGDPNGAEELFAYSAAKDFVRKKLLSPGSAKFPLIPPDSAAHGGGRYTFGGYVDSQNESGVLIRREWAVTVRRRAAGVGVVEFDLERIEVK